MSTDSSGDYQRIQSAITNKDTSCAACHGNNVDHEAKHVSTLNTNCLSCHDANLSKEHREHPKRTGGRDLTCETCHSNGDKAVKRTIAGNSLDCAGCHKRAATVICFNTESRDGSGSQVGYRTEIWYK